MNKKTETIDVETIELVEEVHDRVDVLLKLLIEKEVLSEGEYEAKLKEFLEDKYQ